MGEVWSEQSFFLKAEICSVGYRQIIDMKYAYHPVGGRPYATDSDSGVSPESAYKIYLKSRVCYFSINSWVSSLP